MDEAVTLRLVDERDLDAFFEMYCDPESVRMAAFVPKHLTERESARSHWLRVLVEPTVVARTVMVGDAVAGSVLMFPLGGMPHIGYWFDRAYWGRGLGTQAVKQFLAELTDRPLYAAAAADNVGSRRILEKCGFEVVETMRAFAEGRGEEIDELLFRLG